MQPAWIAFEYYRLEIVQQWPNSPYKEATLNAVRSSLASLMSQCSDAPGSSLGGAHGSIKQETTTIEFPNTSRIRKEPANMAA